VSNYFSDANQLVINFRYSLIIGTNKETIMTVFKMIVIRVSLIVAGSVFAWPAIIEGKIILESVASSFQIAGF